MKAPATYIGLDPSLTSFGVAVLGANGEHIKSTAIKIAKSKYAGDYVRSDAIVRTLFSYLSAYTGPETLVVVESSAAWSKRAGKLAQRLELVGTIKSYLRDYGCSILSVTPRQLKLATAGDGGAADLIYAVNARYGFFTTSHDVADAFALAKYGYRWAAMNENLGVTWDSDNGFVVR